MVDMQCDHTQVTRIQRRSHGRVFYRHECLCPHGMIRGFEAPSSRSPRLRRRTLELKRQRLLDLRCEDDHPGLVGHD